jgi:DNA modification methylase
MEIINYPIKPEKQKAWHLYMHPYFTKQASNIVSAYIQHYTKPGETVLDPFCGTGVTAAEALALKRKVIMMDLNPLACFITEQTVAKINTEKFKDEFNKLYNSVGKDIEKIDKLPKSETDKMEIKYWYPQGIRLPRNTDKGFDFVEQLWTRRQLIGLSILWNEINKIEDIEIRDQMKLVFSSTISRVNITYNLSMTRQKEDKLKLGDGGAALFAQYRYWFPKSIIELKVWERFNYRFNRILKGKEKWNSITNGFNVKDNFICINGSVSELSRHIPEGTIDYIYTDPPYGGNIAYLDLSTMWNAWLGYEINTHAREEEIIEGGDLDKTQEDYEKLFSKSFEEMSTVLKKDGWLSLVFAHKKLEFWNLIIDSNESNGMEFKGSVYQPTNNSSIHFKKNPATVLCSQRIANFKKTFEKPVREKPDDLKKFILNEIERACLEQRGASLDIIYQRVLDQLLNNNTIHEAKKKGYLKLNTMLNNTDMFVYEPDTNRYYVKADENKNEHFKREYFKNRNELQIFLKSLLKQKKALSLDEIHMEIFEIYSDDKEFPIDRLHHDLQEILSEIAIKNKDTNKWILKSEQTFIDFGEIISEKLVKIQPGNSTHSEVIFRLVQIGRYLGFKSWIGKREQSVESFQDYKFSEISIIELPITDDEKFQTDKISQIDVIWFDKLNNPRYAFEVEESTNIMTGFERFKNLLDYNHDISKKLFIVAPKNRKRKIEDVFKNSTYIGHPLYFENKIGLIYKEELIRFYDEHLDMDFNEKDFSLIFEEI